MKPYVDLRAPWRIASLIFTPIALALFCLVYGFFFALTAPYLLVAFAAPIAALALLAIWALPERRHVPTKTMEWFFSGALICLVIWPNYLALVLPGLPWITATRLTGTPMALLFLIALSTSSTFRAQVANVAKAIPNLWVWFALFILVQFATIVFSKNPSSSLSKLIIQQQNWVVMALVAAWVCGIPGRAERYAKTIFLLLIPIFIVAFVEYSQKQLLWNGHVPQFLKIEDPNIASVVYSSITRSGSGQYRAKAVWPTPLGLGEFVALVTPFAMHFAINKYRLILRIIAFAAVPTIYYCSRLADARLGVLGFLISVALYVLFWGAMRFRRNRRDLLAATVVYAYPAALAAAAVAVTSIRSINTLVLGGGATAGSNEARVHQLVMGIPKILTNPIGHGGGGGGEAMGYAEGAFIAIDNYYLLLGLEYGVIGLVTFIGIFLLTIIWSFRSVLALADVDHDRELSLLTPIACSLSAFLVIKLVFAQADLHSMMFILVGVASALVLRAQQVIEKRQVELANVEAATQRQRMPASLDEEDGETADDETPLIRPRPVRPLPPLPSPT